jgi:hypothetical protein
VQRRALVARAGNYAARYGCSCPPIEYHRQGLNCVSAGLSAGVEMITESESAIICSYSFTLIILGSQEVLMARIDPRFRSEKTSIQVDIQCSAAARAVAQLGFVINFVGKLLAACILIGAAGFVAVLSEPTSSRLISFAMLGVVPALAARILGWALYQALKSASCSCHISNSPLSAGRCGQARANYGRQMKTMSRTPVASSKQGRANAVRTAFNAGFISTADRRSRAHNAHNEGRRPS